MSSKRSMKKKSFKKPSNLTKRIKNVEKHIRTMETDEEVKFTQRVNNNVPVDDDITSAGVLYTLNGITLGLDQQDRIGAQMKCTSVHIRGHIHPLLNGTPTETRLIIFWDRQANGLAPTMVGPFASALLDTSSGIVAVHAPINMVNRSRYTVLWDKTYVMQNQGVSNFTVDAIAINKYFRLNRRTQYNATSNTGGIGDITTNALYLYVVGNIAPLAGTNPQFTFCSEVRYKDD